MLQYMFVLHTSSWSDPLYTISQCLSVGRESQDWLAAKAVSRGCYTFWPKKMVALRVVLAEHLTGTDFKQHAVMLYPSTMLSLLGLYFDKNFAAPM
jgi:hypothetical protein